MSEISSYEQFCRAFKNSEAREIAELLLNEQDWIINILKNIQDDYFDSSLDELFINSNKKITSTQKMDMLSYINEQVEDACKCIFMNMHEKIIRENVSMPVYKAKEINEYGIMLLSRRPGRTIREKIASNHSLVAVKRRMSLDTGENRLFVAFIKEIRYLFEARQDNMPKEYIDSKELDFYQKILSFLKNEELNEIKNWENLPPNNTLLSDNYYKKVWKAWTEVKKLDERIYKYYNLLDEYLLLTLFIELILKLKLYFDFPQIPIVVDYLEYNIELICDNFFGINQIGEKINLKKLNNDIVIEFKNISYRISISSCNMIFYKKDISNKEIIINEEHINSSNIDMVVEQIVAELKCSEKNFEINKAKRQRYRNTVIDFFLVYPMYIANDKEVQILDTRILQQSFIKNTKKTKSYNISGANADAIFIKDDVKTSTILSAICQSSKDDVKKLVMLLRKNIISDTMTFIFPDIFNDFQLSQLHKAARLAYRKVRIFPKSIGCVFKYQESQEFKQDFNLNDFILVVDLVDDEISMTLVEGVFDENINKQLNKYKGIRWERHPTFSVSCSEYIEKIYSILKKYNCQQPEVIYKALGIDGIISEEGKLLAIFKNEGYFRISKNIVAEIKNLKINITKIVDEFISNRKDIIKNSKVHILTEKDIFSYNSLNKYHVLKKGDSLYGYSKYEKLKEEISIPLWRDHLPDLAIKLLYEKFDLVNKATVLPSFNSVQAINIDSTFTLKKNKKSYRFKLVQNDINDKIQYEAVIKHTMFPLKQDIECKLRMMYKYGEEEPYELAFVPIDKNKAGFYEAKVQWNPIDEYEYMGLPYPNFPTKLTWNDFINFPKKDGSGHQNITRFLSNKEDFELLSGPYYTIKKDLIDLDEVCKGRNQHFAMLVDGQRADVEFSRRFFEKDFESNFKIKNDKFVYKKETVSFNISPKKTKNRYIAKYIRANDGPSEYIANNYKLFVMHTIFFDGRSIYESGCPVGLRENFEKCVPHWVRIYYGCDDDLIKKRIFKMMSLAAKDIGTVYYDIANKMADDYISEESNGLSSVIGYSLGDLSLGYQKLLFKKLTGKKSDLIVLALSRAMWKNNDFVFNAPSEVLIEYFEFTIDKLNEIISKFKAKSKKKVLPRDISMYLEYIIGVFRLRKLNNKKINKKLSLNNPKVRLLYSLIEKVIKMKFSIETRLELEIDNKYENMEDIFFALLVYITGDDGDSDIKISGVREE